jgi:hypothetical protein
MLSALRRELKNEFYLFSNNDKRNTPKIVLIWNMVISKCIKFIPKLEKCHKNFQSLIEDVLIVGFRYRFADGDIID